MRLLENFVKLPEHATKAVVLGPHQSQERTRSIHSGLRHRAARHDFHDGLSNIVAPTVELVDLAIPTEEVHHIDVLSMTRFAKNLLAPPIYMCDH